MVKKRLVVSKIINPNYQNIINISIIFNYIYDRGTASRANIAKNLNISFPAVSRAIEKLKKEEFIVEAEKIKTSSGKRPLMFKINKDKGFVIGVDLGKKKPLFALTNYWGEVIEKHEGSEIKDNNRLIDNFLLELNDFIEFCKKKKIKKIDLISIGLPGIIDKENEKISSMSLYSSLENVNFKKLIYSRFKIPIFIENDTCLSAIGEKKYGIGKKYRDFAYVNVSNGVGAGIIIDNRLYRGYFNYAGEFGFSIINEKNLGYKTIDKGFLEKNASIESLRDRGIEAIKKNKKTIISNMINNDIKKITPEIICSAAFEEDKIAQDIIRKTINYLSVGLINLILFINPQIIIIGGDICELPYCNELFIKPIEKNIKNSIPFSTPEIKLSSLNSNAGVLGAAFNAIESMLIEKFPFKLI